VRVGIEATGYARWFERMLRGQGHELWIGDASAIRAARVRQQKTDVRDAQLLLDLLIQNRFPKIWVASPEERDLWQLLRHRDKLVRLRTSVRNQLHALAMGEGLCRKKKLWTERGRQQLQGLVLDEWAQRRRGELLELLDRFDGSVAELDQAVVEQAQSHPTAVRLMQQPGVGPITGLALALAVGPVQRFPNSRHLVSYLGLNPRESSSGGKQRLGAISKQGNRLVRWLLVEAAHTASRKDAELRRVYQRLVQRRGRAVAKVAVARKLAVRLYWVLREAAPPTRTQGSSPSPLVGVTRPMP
jgi:transposase